MGTESDFEATTSQKRAVFENLWTPYPTKQIKFLILHVSKMLGILKKKQNFKVFEENLHVTQGESPKHTCHISEYSDPSNGH